VLDPEFEQARTALQKIVDYNIAHPKHQFSGLLPRSSEGQDRHPGELSVTLVLAWICGYFLVQAINRPLAQLHRRRRCDAQREFFAAAEAGEER